MRKTHEVQIQEKDQFVDNLQAIIAEQDERIKELEDNVGERILFHFLTKKLCKLSPNFRFGMICFSIRIILILIKMFLYSCNPSVP